MILLEQYIALKIYHEDSHKKYDVLEVGNVDEGVWFIVLYPEYYFFTQVPKKNDSPGFMLSKFDRQESISIDCDLYFKIEVSHY